MRVFYGVLLSKNSSQKPDMAPACSGWGASKIIKFSISKSVLDCVFVIKISCDKGVAEGHGSIIGTGFVKCLLMQLDWQWIIWYATVLVHNRLLLYLLFLKLYYIEWTKHCILKEYIKTIGASLQRTCPTIVYLLLTNTRSYTYIPLGGYISFSNFYLNTINSSSIQWYTA